MSGVFKTEEDFSATHTHTHTRIPKQMPTETDKLTNPHTFVHYMCLNNSYPAVVVRSIRYYSGPL